MSHPQRSHHNSYARNGVLGNPIDVVDVNLLDTSNWTADDWQAAQFLAEKLMLSNADKGVYHQGPIQGM